jgi:hypothetical protein
LALLFSCSFEKAKKRSSRWLIFSHVRHDDAQLFLILPRCSVQCYGKLSFRNLISGAAYVSHFFFGCGWADIDADGDIVSHSRRCGAINVLRRDAEQSGRFYGRHGFGVDRR